MATTATRSPPRLRRRTSVGATDSDSIETLPNSIDTRGSDFGQAPTSAKQLTQFLRVTDGVVRVAVVEDRVNLGGALRHVLELGRPRLQLAWLIEVAKLFRGADAFLLPVLCVVAVKAHHAERRRGGDYRRHAGREALGLVNHYVGVVVVLQKLDDALTPGLLHPQRLAKLDRDPEVRQPLAQVFHEPIGRRRGKKPLGELEDDRTQLARILQRLHPLAEAIPHTFLLFGPQILEVEVGLRIGHLFPQVFRQAGDRGRMLGQQRVRLGVEGEVVRCARDPQLRGLLTGDRVEGTVDLDHRKLRGVITEPLLRRRRVRGIPPALDQGRLRPGRNPDLDASHQLGRWAAGASLTSPRSVRRPCGSASMTASRLSTTPRGLPGRASTSVRPMTPASERDSIACGVLRRPAARIASAIPGTG